jgi:valyl-tRNA synthetase
MKKLYITLLLFLTLSVTAQIDLGTIPPYAVCDNNADGYADFLLQTHVPEVLGDLSSANYSVTFYLSQADAVAGTNTLPNLFTNTTPNLQTLFVRVTENANTANIGVASFSLVIDSAPVVNFPPTIILAI